MDMEQLRYKVFIAKEYERIQRQQDFYKFVIETVPNFKTGWFYEDLYSRLQQFCGAIKSKTSPRLMLNVPPRHLKSESTSVRFALWMMLNNPGFQVICSSYGQRLSEGFSKKARELLEHPYVKATWPKISLREGYGGVNDWQLSNGSSYFATGVGGTCTGKGADLFLVDDPIPDLQAAYSEAYLNTLYDWYSAVAYTRLMPGGGVLVMQTRFSEKDLSGWLLDKAKKDATADQWEQIIYEAIAEKDESHRKAGEALLPDWFSEERLQQIKKAVGSKTWAALYQQNPRSEGDSMFKEQWFKRYDKLPEPASKREFVSAWDLAFTGKSTSDFCVGTVWCRHGANYYLVDMYRKQIDFAGLVRDFVEFLKKHPYCRTHLVEAKANGEALLSTLKSAVPGLIGVDPESKDKVTRASFIVPACEAGNVFLPESSWVGDWLEEMCAFPGNSKHDDVVDSSCYGLTRLIKSSTEGFSLQALGDLAKYF